MTAGWAILDRIGTTDPDAELDATLVADVADELGKLNATIRADVIGRLRAGGRGKYADGLAGGFNNDELLFNSYFANKAYSWSIGHGVPPDALDAPRAAIILYLSLKLQSFLVDSLRGAPKANVMNAASSPNPAGFARTYRFVVLRQLLNASKTVQFDIEGFAGTVCQLLANPEAPVVGRSTHWPFDADVLLPLVLLGYAPASSPDVVNSIVLGSPMYPFDESRS